MKCRSRTDRPITIRPNSSALWSSFRGCLGHNAAPINRLVCIGYGFADEHVNAVIEAALARTDFTLLIFAKALEKAAWSRWSAKANVIIVTESQCSLKGQTGLALFTAGISSFIGGTVAIVVLSTMAPALGEVGLLFGPADYCALMLLGFFCVSFVSAGSLLNGLAMAMIGVLLGMVGTDVNSGVARYTMDLPFLMDGIGLISIALGCFGIAEVVKNLDEKNVLTPFNGTIKLMPTWPQFKRIIPSALRGSVVGSILGILPGGGPTIAQFAAYAVDKKFSKFKHEIGTGCIEGVAGQAAADEAAARTSFIPLMAIGIPENAVMALMLAAFTVKGIQPGPNMIATHPDLFWGLVASMWIGNCFLVILNVPLVRYWLSVFKIPYTVLFPAILFFCCIGTFSINNSLDDIFITAVFGLVGYLFLRLNMEAAPLLLGFILGPMLEENFRRSMLLSRGSFDTFVTRPISGTLLVVIAILILWQLVTFVRGSRKGPGLPLAVDTPVAAG